MTGSINNATSATLSGDEPCPCSSNDGGISYADCCQPYHLGIPTPSAVVLMRSRYSAIVLQNVDYILATTVPAQAVLLDREILKSWMANTLWIGLTVVSHSPKIGKRHAEVLFDARFMDKHDDSRALQIHRERSAFVRISEHDGIQRWYFIDPTVVLNLTGKQPCLCGSSEKYKACCGKFLS